MAGIAKLPLAPTGSVGNNSHAQVVPNPGSSKIAVEFVVEAVGATPTVTFQLQGCMNVPGDGAPAATDWNIVNLLPPDSDTPATTKAVTAVGRYVLYVAQSNIRFFRQFRLVTTLNTNVTYSASLVEAL